MRPDHLAREAERLKNDDVLKHALSEMRADALEALATVNPTDSQAITQCQADIRAIDEFRSMLERYILAQRQDDLGTVV